ncbi:MAG: terminase large subunit [Lagierella massiliensis]|nr:terminase large subunit [Lagierella massiliensis]
MKRMSIDIETYSSIDLGKCGVYKYAESEDFEILLFACAIDDGEVRVIDLANGETIPHEILSALSDKSIEKWAFNANFERVCLSRFIGEKLKPNGWYCTMVWSAYLGLPLSLEKVGEVLKLDKQKMTEGKSLIRYFSIPCKPTKTNGMRNRNLPHNDKEKWSTFKEYNKRDVETEMAIKNKLSAFPLPKKEWKNYWIDQTINDRGILIDEVLFDTAIQLDERLRNENMKKAIELTGLENPNSPLQLKEWLNKKGLQIESLAKKDVESALKNAKGDIKEILELRQELSKSSVRKYDAMKNVKGSDNRARGLIQFYGANRTGRYSGRLIQVQNLEGMGFTVVPFGQGFKDMSPPTKELMKLPLERKLVHGGHPVLRWMMDNIFIRTDPAGNIKADKEKSTEKIDGVIATIMALDRAIRCGNDTNESVYDDRGLIVF